MQVEELTKKEQIINFARHDPFLKISDIAEHVDTTPRYVRTILSEANISLMELREKHARNMEKRLDGRESELQKATIRLLNQEGELKGGEVQVQKLEEVEFEELVRTDMREELYQIRQKKKAGAEISALQEIITYLSSDIDPDQIKDLSSLYELFGGKGINNLDMENNVIQVEEANRVLASQLEIKKDAPVVKSQRTIKVDKMPIGIENYYFNAENIQLVLPGELVV